MKGMHDFWLLHIKLPTSDVSMNYRDFLKRNQTQKTDCDNRLILGKKVWIANAGELVFDRHLALNNVINATFL